MSETATMNSSRYHRWSGKRSGTRWTWLAVVTTGVRLTYQRSHVRFLLSMGLGFILGTCTIFYVLSVVESVVGTDEARVGYGFLNTLLGVDLSSAARIGEFRATLWRTTFMLTIKLQLVWVMLVVARIGPGLIADDLKARALPIYFARPIQPLSYLAGKWLVAAVFIAVVMLVPNLLSLILGTLITGGGPGTFRETLKLGGELLLSGGGVVVVGGTLILALSSLSSDKRYVAMGWLAVCLLPMTTQSILATALPADKMHGFLGSISLNGNILVLSEWLFDLREAWKVTPLPPAAFDRALGSPIKPLYPAVVLLGVTVISGLVCYRRVVRFARAAANV